MSGVITSRDGFRILKLVAREAPGLRTLEDPRVEESIRTTLRNRKEQLLRASYMTAVRDEAKVANYLAQQIIESAGKLPEVSAKPAGSEAAQPTK
jgi:peptidyl-prolyl cis-trans isomerase SurA